MNRCQYCSREVSRRLEYERQLKAVEHEAKQLRLRARKLAKQLRSLIADSDGVVGLHRNGDVAEWGELLRGGAYEDWLDGLDDLEELLPGRRVVVKLPSYEQVLEADLKAYETWKERFLAMEPSRRDRVFRRLCGLYLREALR